MQSVFDTRGLDHKGQNHGLAHDKEAMGFACHQSQRAAGIGCAVLTAALMLGNPEKNNTETQPVKAALCPPAANARICAGRWRR
jgi:hypothetical protein